MPWLETDVTEQRLKFLIEALDGKRPMATVCQSFGISRTTGHTWVARYRACGSLTRGVEEASRRPAHSPGRTAAAVTARVVGLRQQYGWGGRTLRVLLQQEGLALARATVDRILKREGLVRPEDSHPPAPRRFGRSAPNERWQVDFKGQYPVRGGWCFPLSVLDDHSRFAVGLFALPDLWTHQTRPQGPWKPHTPRFPQRPQPPKFLSRCVNHVLRPDCQ